MHVGNVLPYHWATLACPVSCEPELTAGDPVTLLLEIGVTTVRVGRIERPSAEWKSAVLPLNDTRRIESPPEGQALGVDGAISPSTTSSA